ncbi:FAD-dependent oxidoreductase [Pseudactinotalea sp.]|uniref:FAD-dependent oxidoreductase n=1 Tax=Pseudactinotalea sp. TaxID=1926260 RepID=UPI003B3AEA9C
MTERTITCDVAIIGGSLGGVAAALAACRRNATVLLASEVEWLGGQLTSQAVPPDEHPWIESMGATASYRALRDGIRDAYRTGFPLTDRARDWAELNPGAGSVSKLCHEPRVAVDVIEQMLRPHVAAGRLQILRNVVPVAAAAERDVVQRVTLRGPDGEEAAVTATYFIDATELGDMLPLAGVEYVTGFESQADTDEPHAPALAQPDNIQALSWCFALDHVEGDHTIDRPERYQFWRDLVPPTWPGPLLGFASPHPRTDEPNIQTFVPNPGDDPFAMVADQSTNMADENLWLCRRLAARDVFRPGAYGSDISLVNWSMIDYFLGSVIDVDEPTRAARLADAKQLGLSVLYWLQTDAPRPDGGTGWPGLRLRPDVVGTEDGFAQGPYYRESRRIRPLRRVLEQDLSLAVRGDRGAVHYPDSVGIGMYRIDLHPSTGGDGYIDVGASPFEIPLGALIPERVQNVLAACKNIGTTHITNGCYRLHPVEWNIGEVAGALAADCVASGLVPHKVWESEPALAEFQDRLTADGVPLRWPDGVRGY